MPATRFAALSDGDLIEQVVSEGSRLLQSSRQRLANLGDVLDDPRWEAPFPLRFEAQVAYLFLGGIDAFDVSIGLLRRRASQQAFNTMRFQLETLALLRWMTRPSEAVERQRRAYRVVCGELRRFGKFLLEDAGKDRDALKRVADVRKWARQLTSIATEDGFPHLNGPPGRRALLGKHGETSGYPTFSMLSELGSHPPAPGNTFLVLRPDSRKISYELERPTPARTFFAATAIFYAWQTCGVVAKALGWDRWLAEEATPIYNRAAEPMYEALKRWTAQGHPASNPPSAEEQGSV